MDKNKIKQMLREGYPVTPEVNEEEQREKNSKYDYSDIQTFLNRDMAPSQVGVMKAALGWEDDKDGTNRSLFHKKLVQDKNDEGSYYQFNTQELARIRAALKLK